MFGGFEGVRISGEGQGFVTDIRGFDFGTPLFSGVV